MVCLYFVMAGLFTYSELVDANISVFASEIRFKLYVVASHNFPMYFSRCLHNKC